MKRIIVSVKEEVKDKWYKYACSKGYMNFSQFVRDIINEKIEKDKNVKQ